MTVVHVNGLVQFSANNGIWLDPSARYANPFDLIKAINIAFDHIDDDVLVEACCGARGPLTGYSDISIESYLQLKLAIEQVKLTDRAKRRLTRERRQEFNRNRSQIALAMIDNGVPYVCSVDGCGCTEDLTIDHIVPLSRGGTDDLSNFRFMCRKHNSSKGDRQ